VTTTLTMREMNNGTGPGPHAPDGRFAAAGDVGHSQSFSWIETHIPPAAAGDVGHSQSFSWIETHIPPAAAGEVGHSQASSSLENRIPSRVAAALELGAEWASRGWQHGEAQAGPFRRHVAVGDPQASFETYLRILDRHELLGEDGRLRSDVSLLSIGDHFDYEGDIDTVRRDGLRLLIWLAGHPDAQVVILAGNHDLCRVVELVRVSDPRFARARQAARAINEMRKRGDQPDALHEARARFLEDFPEIPTPKVANRDWGSFTEAQRGLVQELLVAGRMSLAKVGLGKDGRRILLTHAGVTRTDLELLGLPAQSGAEAIAAELQSRLFDAVAPATDRWDQGEGTPLDLAPIYVPGGSGHEGGGILYHRPAHPDSMAREGERASRAPRRFDPRTLPLGLVQACGHAGHRKCAEDLGPWVSLEARAVVRGGLRTLRTDGADVSYEMGIRPVAPGEGGLYMIDGEMNRVPVEEYPVLDLEGWIEAS
jgi:hypothetical protein